MDPDRMRFRTREKTANIDAMLTPPNSSPGPKGDPPGRLIWTKRRTAATMYEE